jgi:hypothetical protein
VTLTMPVTSAVLVGEVIATVRADLSTVMFTAAEVAELFAASRARAVNTGAPCVAVDVSHEVESGEVSPQPLSGCHREGTAQPTRPTLSDAVAATLIAPETVASLVGAVSETVVAFLPGGEARVVPLTTADLCESLPAASKALTA